MNNMMKAGPFINLCPVQLVKASQKESVLLLKSIRRWIVLFIACLVISGITAFPVYTEIHFLLYHQNFIPDFALSWLQKTGEGIDVMTEKYPFLFYGYDWLAYSHIIIALFFIGVYRNPVQNAWVLRTGMIACAGIFILAGVCGQIRGIPFFWTLTDCSFGIFGIIPLLITQRKIQQLAEYQRDYKMI